MLHGRLHRYDLGDDTCGNRTPPQSPPAQMAEISKALAERRDDVPSVVDSLGRHHRSDDLRAEPYGLKKGGNAPARSARV